MLFYLFRIDIIIMKLSVFCIIFYSVILYALVSCRKFRRRRNHLNHDGEILFNNEYPDELSSKLIYCSEKSEKEHYCVYIDKFHIARNQSFDCSDQYLGVIVKIPELDENGSRTDHSEQVFCYLTTHTTGKYTFIEQKQYTSLSDCQELKQYVKYFSNFFKYIIDMCFC